MTLYPSLEEGNPSAPGSTNVVPTEATVPEFRRNGKIPSCEPCRKSKLRCDHGKPTCQRCQTRRKECVYHPAPMTKRNNVDSPATPPATPSESQTSELPHTLNPDPSESLISRAPDGYLGGTSFLAPLTESQQDIRDAAGIEHDRLNSRTKLSFSDDCRVEQGAEVLMTLACAIDRMDTLDRRCNVAARTPPPILERCFKSLTESMAEIRSASCRFNRSREMSRELFKNTSRPLPLPGQRSMAEYAESFIGPLTRWETVGAVMAALSLSKATICLNKRNAAELLSKPPSLKVLIDGTNLCLNYCDDLGSLNDIVLWVLGENTIVHTLFYGDASYTAWKKTGDVSSCVFALGIHQTIKVTPEVPRWLAEIRKHNLMFAYATDKSASVFVGRPPRISKRYVRLEAPVFINLDLLALPPGELEAAIQERGDAVIGPHPLAGFSVYYANLNCFMLREEILELFLGNTDLMSKEELEVAVASISQRSRNEWDNKPADMRYDPSVWSSDKSPDECYGLNITFLDHLYNDWLLQRVIVQRLHGDSFELLRLSGELLTNGLAVVTQAAGDIGWVLCDLPWSIMLFCLPAAGVLILELLRQAKIRNYTTTAFSRSSVIQNLSILISTLDWIAQPGIGNYELCRQARDMLRRSLDRVLDPSLMARDEMQEQSTNGQPTSNVTNSANDPGFPVTDGLMDWSPEQWLGVDADAGFWSNLEDHSLLMFNAADAFWPSSQNAG